MLKDVALSACYLVPTVAYGPSRACGAAAANCALCVDRGKPFKAVVMPVVSAAPLALRLAQCASRFRASRSRWPHLFNASKYVGSLAVVGSAGAFPTRHRCRSALRTQIPFVPFLLSGASLECSLQVRCQDLALFKKAGLLESRRALMHETRVPLGRGAHRDTHCRTHAPRLLSIPRPFISRTVRLSSRETSGSGDRERRPHRTD